jgi:hypothetical protein
MGHAAHTGQKRKMYRVLVEEPEGKNCFEDLTLKWILKKQDSSGLGKGQMTGSCEHRTF